MNIDFSCSLVGRESSARGYICAGLRWKLQNDSSLPVSMFSLNQPFQGMLFSWQIAGEQEVEYLLPLEAFCVTSDRIPLTKASHLAIPHQWPDVYSTHTKGDTAKSLGKGCECKIITHEGSEEWWTMMHPMTEDNQHCQGMQLSVVWVSQDLPGAC